MFHVLLFLLQGEKGDGGLPGPTGPQGIPVSLVKLLNLCHVPKLGFMLGRSCGGLPCSKINFSFFGKYIFFKFSTSPDCLSVKLVSWCQQTFVVKPNSKAS